MTIMMLGVEDYGSDNDNDSTPSTSKLPPSPPAKKSSISLPPPSKPSGSGLSLPPLKSKRGPKKITIGPPSLPGHTNDSENEGDESPAAKKPRLDSGSSGAGKSSLLSMLPAPKQKVPVIAPPERVLGGGKGLGLVFSTYKPSAAPVSIDTADEVDDPLTKSHSPASVFTMNGDSEEEDSKASSVSFLPLSLKKGRSNISLEEGNAPPRPPSQVSAAPAVDFFSLGNTTFSQATLKPTTSTPISSSQSSSSSPSRTTMQLLSSAPVIEEFTPPEPTPTDPYPGYYQLPSGAWAAHDPAYYKTFYDKWTKEYNAHVRSLEKGSVRGFEGYDAYAPSGSELGDGGPQEVDMGKEMERAKKEIKEREDRKALTGGAAKEGQLMEPRMNIKGAKLGKMARGRHQLTTLLSEAYQNREALEERIAEGRRNRKEAGNKYGF